MPETISADLIVIGSGLAGTAAALAAARSGRKVIVVSRGSGASHLSSGALDVADDPLSVPGHPEQSSREIQHNLKQLLLRFPHHPYQLLADGPDPIGAILNPIQAALFQLFPATGDFRLAGSFAQNRWVWTTLGTLKATAFTAEAIAVLGDPALSRPLVIGLEEYPDFDPGFWPQVAAPLAARMGAPMRGGQSTWIRLGEAAELSAPEISRRLEEEELAARFCSALQAEAKAFPDLTGLLLPPVLPPKNRGRLLEKIQAVTGVPARELLGWPASVPGLRLGRHLEDSLAQNNISLVRGSVSGFEAGNGQIHFLLVENAAGRKKFTAPRFVLAAGSWAGGGLVKEKSFRETIFDLPVFCGEHVVNEIFTQKLTREVISESHLLFTCGVKADHSLRPVGPAGKPIYQNLFVAGAILQGSDPARDGTGAGVALATGWRAGSLAAGSE